METEREQLSPCSQKHTSPEAPAAEGTAVVPWPGQGTGTALLGHHPGRATGVSRTSAAGQVPETRAHNLLKTKWPVAPGLSQAGRPPPEPGRLSAALDFTPKTQLPPPPVPAVAGWGPGGPAGRLWAQWIPGSRRTPIRGWFPCF